jgi:3'(2'), 5'-bisphosphate nucleotidase
MLDELTAIASRAAGAIISAKATGLQPRTKPNHSPVTAADEAAEEIVIGGLSRLIPDVAIISEEASARQPRDVSSGRFFLVDPLDGTHELLAGEDEYTVNIALIEHGHSIAGVVAAPALGVIWRGLVGHGAERLRLAPGAPLDRATERKTIRTRRMPLDAPVAVTSRFHPEPETGAYLDAIPGVRRVTCGSSLKFCRIAEGTADLYPRLAALSEWDVAAGHALVTAAGGAVTTINGGPLTYRGRPNFRLPPFVAWGEPPQKAR